MSARSGKASKMQVFLFFDLFSANCRKKETRLSFFDETKIQGGVLITIKKNIPSAAGLAGGSSDAAATLKGLNKLYNTNLSREKLILMSAKLGSDVGFFIDTKIAQIGRAHV